MTVSSTKADTDALAAIILAADGFSLPLHAVPPAMGRRYRGLAMAALTWMESRKPVVAAEGELPLMFTEEMDPNSLGEGWNVLCATIARLPQVTLPLSAERRRKAAVRLREHPDPDWWSEIFKKVRESKFLRGESGGTGAHANWRCTFDWLIANDSNAVKVMEGQYDRGGKR